MATRRSKRVQVIIGIAAMLLVWIGAGTLAFAARDDHRYRSPHWELDTRHGHNHYYPARNYIVPVLPPDHVDIVFGGNHFFFRSGVWFRARGPKFIVVAPPLGIAVPVLPPAYTTVWVGGIPYYYANDVYYSQVPGTTGYTVVTPPPGAEGGVIQSPTPPIPPAPAPPSTAGDGLFVYPSDGQTEAQLSTDRADCTRWAMSQTGYDPAKANSMQQRSDYQRAMGACLEGRGYTVR